MSLAAACDQSESTLSLPMRFWNSYAKVYGSVENLIPHRRMIEDVVELVPQDASRVLDAGCGSGALLANLSTNRPELELHGADFSSEMLGRARERTPSANAIQADLNKPLPYEDGFFDCVASTNALYALSSPSSAVSEFYRVVRPGGRIVIATPRQQAVGLKILASHLGAVPIARGIVDLVRFGACLIPNLIIEQKARKDTYHFFTEDQLLRLAPNVEIHHATFAGQNWLVTIDKPNR